MWIKFSESNPIVVWKFAFRSHFLVVFTISRVSNSRRLLLRSFVTSSKGFLFCFTLIFSMTSVTSTALQLKFVCVTSFLLLGRLRDLPHSAKWLLKSLMELFVVINLINGWVVEISWRDFVWLHDIHYCSQLSSSRPTIEKWRRNSSTVR